MKIQRSLILYPSESDISKPKIFHTVSTQIAISHVGDDFTTKIEVKNYGFLSMA